MRMIQSLVDGIGRVGLAGFAMALLATTAGAADLQEGRDFRALAKPQPVETGKKVEVIEFFSFSCQHCRDMEPILSGWIKKMPADVQLRRIPAQFSPMWVGTAKVWYTLEALGREDLVPAVFTAIHSQSVRLDQDKAFFDWAEKQGVDRKKVEDMYNSFAVAGKLSRAKTQVQSYAIGSVPVFVVDGKWTTETGAQRRHEDIPGILDKLIDRARAERK